MWTDRDIIKMLKSQSKIYSNIIERYGFENMQIDINFYSH